MTGFNKTEWLTVRLGDIVKNISIHEKYPLEKGLQYYVGLEHLESENLKIKRWGRIKEGTSFTKTFKQGQILFGRRRAYLHKAALAEFSGICSGDIFVLDVKNNKLIQQLLPFIIQNDKFFDYAMKTSAGSLSPRTKWKFLVEFEILLPKSINEQHRIARLLWKIEDCINKKDETIEKTKKYIRVFSEHIFHYGLSNFNKLDSISLRNNKIGNIPKDWSYVMLKDYIDFIKGIESGSKYYNKDGEGVRYLRVNDLTTKQENMLYSTAENLLNIEEKDILLSLDGNPGVVKRGLTGAISSGIRKIEIKKDHLNQDFLYYLLKTSFVQDVIEKYSFGDIIKHASRAIEHIKVPIPPLEEQLKIAGILSKLYQILKSLKKHKITLIKLRKRIINDTIYS